MKTVYALVISGCVLMGFAAALLLRTVTLSRYLLEGTASALPGAAPATYFLVVSPADLVAGALFGLGAGLLICGLIKARR